MTSTHLSILVVFACLLVFNLPQPVFAAPARRGIAINSSEKTCTNYSAGDDFSQHVLPSGWEEYYPEWKYAVIETSLGSCQFNSFSDFYTTEVTDNWNSCFQSLGCSYVDFDYFKKVHTAFLSKNRCMNLSKNEFWGTFLAVDTNYKQCTLMTCAQNATSSTAESYQKYSHGLEVYSQPQEYVSFKTQAGVCTIQILADDRDNFAECCEQLGFTFVKDVRATSQNVTNYDIVPIATLSVFTVVVFFGLIAFRKYKGHKEQNWPS